MQWGGGYAVIFKDDGRDIAYCWKRYEGNCDTNKATKRLSVSSPKGDFTCCACDHDFGTGVKVRCDKSKGENLILDFLYHNLTELVWPVLARMCNDAARYYKQNGK